MITTEGVMKNGSAIERSTIYVSFVYEQYPRLFLYIGLSSFVLFILSLAFYRRYSIEKFLFFLAAVPGIFLEGLGLISYLMCFGLFASETLTIKLGRQRR
jgi:hypothetical protein